MEYLDQMCVFSQTPDSVFVLFRIAHGTEVFELLGALVARSPAPPEPGPTPTRPDLKKPGPTPSPPDPEPTPTRPEV